MSAKAELVQMDVKAYMKDVGERARAAARDIGKAETGVAKQQISALETERDVELRGDGFRAAGPTAERV